MKIVTSDRVLIQVLHVAGGLGEHLHVSKWDMGIQE